MGIFKRKSKAGTDQIIIDTDDLVLEGEGSPVGSTKDGEADPNTERFEKLEQTVGELRQSSSEVLDLLKNGMRQGAEPLKQEPSVEPQVQDPNPEPAVNKFVDDLWERGEAAILDNPTIMGAISQLNANHGQFVAAKSELMKEHPKLYDTENPIGKSRLAKRQMFLDAGVHPTILDSREMEDMVSHSALGANIDEVMKTKTQSKIPAEAYVEGGNVVGDGQDQKVALTEEQSEVAAQFGLSDEEYAKNRKDLVDAGALEE